MLRDKTILITGATSGIGNGINKVLANRSAALILTGRNKEKLQSVLAGINGTNHKYIIADLLVDENITSLVSVLPKLDGIVFCAGYNEYLPFKFIKKETTEQIFAVNYFSSISLLQKIIKSKLLNFGASLVFISSISSEMGVPGTTVYAASKAAINSTVMVLASELAPQKIRVNAISPGIILTPMLEQGNIDISQIKEQEKHYPLGFGTPEDVGSLVAFLLSNESRWITGNIVKLDGGYTLQ